MTLQEDDLTDEIGLHKSKAINKLYSVCSCLTTLKFFFYWYWKSYIFFCVFSKTFKLSFKFFYHLFHYEKLQESYGFLYLKLQMLWVALLYLSVLWQWCQTLWYFLNTMSLSFVIIYIYIYIYIYTYIYIIL